MARRVIIAAFFLVAAGCASDPKVCVPGDQVICRCLEPTGTSWGYRTCDQNGSGYGPCDCVLGLSPDAGSPLGSPYMSGGGSGSGSRDAASD